METFTDEVGRSRSWADLRRAVVRNINGRYPRVPRESRADAVQHGLASLCASIGRPWLHAGHALDFERCSIHAESRARRHIARQANVLHHEILNGEERESDLATLETDGPEYLVSNHDLGERIQAFVEAFTPGAWADLAPLLARPTDLARSLGISEPAAVRRQAVLRRRLHNAAIAAGFLGGKDGFYDREG